MQNYMLLVPILPSLQIFGHQIELYHQVVVGLLVSMDLWILRESYLPPDVSISSYKRCQ